MSVVTTASLDEKDHKGVLEQLRAHRFILRQAVASLVALEYEDPEFEVKARRVLDDALLKTARDDDEESI